MVGDNEGLQCLYLLLLLLLLVQSKTATRNLASCCTVSN
jgi:hypothetical protein